MTTVDDVTQLVRDYGHLWDADAPRDLVDRVFAPEVVDHDPQPGQRQGREGPGSCSSSTTPCSPTCG